MTIVTGCVLCETDGGPLVFRNDKFHVIQASEAGFPAFYRVIWNEHVVEFSDLSEADRTTCMAAVVVVEEVLRTELQPTKINLAAFGNVVPHLHWHVIARFAWDTHFPAPTWGNAQRPADMTQEARIAAACPAVNRLIALRLQG